MAVATAVTVLSARDQRLQKGLKRGLTSLRRYAKRAAVIAKGVAIAMVAIGLAAVAASVLFLKAFAVQEKAERKLEAVIKATGMAAGFTAEQMKEMASSLQILTSIGDEVIMNGQAILATFKEIKGDEFKDATVAMLDMAAVLDTDLKSAAILVGKALNDPVKGAAALSRSGVTFTKVQIEQIRVMQEAGDVMGAQRLILDELESQFKGAAEALGDTFGGRVSDLKNRLGDLAEQMGEALIPVVDKLISGVSRLVTFFEENIDVIKFWTTIVGGAFVATVGFAIFMIKNLALTFGLLINAMMQAARVSPLGLMTKGVKTLGSDLEKLRGGWESMKKELSRPFKLVLPDTGAAEREARKAAARKALEETKAGAGTARGAGAAEKDKDKKQKASFENLQQMAKRIQIAAAGGDPQTKAVMKTADSTEKMAEGIAKGNQIAKGSMELLKKIVDNEAVSLQGQPVGVFGV